MPILTAPTPASLTKVILIGDSGSGKTGALVSLARAGYNLRILDLDNKVSTGILPRLLRKEPESLARIGYISLRDKFKSSAVGPVPDGVPKAFMDAMKFMDKWDDGTKPEAWGPQYVFVLDTLTFLGMAAYDWAKAMNPGAKEPRTWYWTAQQMIEDFLAQLTHASFNTNVVVNSHITWVTRKDETTKGYPAGIGTALSPKIGAYFENLGLVEALGGKTRQIRFVPTAMVDAKTPLLELPPAMPIEIGLATFFAEDKK